MGVRERIIELPGHMIARGPVPDNGFSAAAPETKNTGVPRGPQPMDIVWQELTFTTVVVRRGLANIW